MANQVLLSCKHICYRFFKIFSDPLVAHVVYINFNSVVEVIRHGLGVTAAQILQDNLRTAAILLNNTEVCHLAYLLVGTYIKRMVSSSFL